MISDLLSIKILEGYAMNIAGHVKFLIILVWNPYDHGIIGSQSMEKNIRSKPV